MKNERVIIGGIIFGIGLIWTIVCFFTLLFMLIYSIPILIIGLVIILNKKEDEIEQRQDLNKLKIKR
ncbi:MAG: hypothetical protein BWY36_00114 [Candidatus Diapherotrites archaeon ADurb.Bin253]|jgi:energy-converting hydrogenase Eha subunit H|nr:hypothetical protein [Candidatus Pacearchaeota archaeon]OQA69190.1 MAG: hypothetical protein BWY36_00114 [Candidatus Diapherotrites archaeon ADurb.Bin253]HNZ51950.1 hypothetical protein [Candidatus Pacearchaeota archaeon]HOC97249.1 hypothetical protein [Candidatus Pacearchaeota archaeon]HOH04029.1 hypothetical protein [Candidatus Pacearchaeota archaeon]